MSFAPQRGAWVFLRVPAGGAAAGSLSRGIRQAELAPEGTRGRVGPYAPVSVGAVGDTLWQRQAERRGRTGGGVGGRGTGRKTPHFLPFLGWPSSAWPARCHKVAGAARGWDEHHAGAMRLTPGGGVKVWAIRPGNRSSGPIFGPGGFDGGCTAASGTWLVRGHACE